MKKKRIIIGSVFAALLLVSISFISAAQEQQASELNTNITNENAMTIEELIEGLQYLHDYISVNYPDDFDEEFLQEFQDNIDALNIEPSEYPLILCVSLLALFLVCITIFVNSENNPVLAGLAFSLACSIFIIAMVYDCIWTKIPVQPYQNEDSACPCCVTSSQINLSNQQSLNK